MPKLVQLNDLITLTTAYGPGFLFPFRLLTFPYIYTKWNRPLPDHNPEVQFLSYTS